MVRCENASAHSLLLSTVLSRPLTCAPTADRRVSVAPQGTPDLGRQPGPRACLGCNHAVHFRPACAKWNCGAHCVYGPSAEHNLKFCPDCSFAWISLVASSPLRSLWPPLSSELQLHLEHLAAQTVLACPPSAAAESSAGLCRGPFAGLNRGCKGGLSAGFQVWVRATCSEMAADSLKFPHAIPRPINS